MRLGEWNKQTNPDCVSLENQKFCCPDPEDIDIESIITHGQYDYYAQYSQNDIALIKLSRAVDYNSKYHNSNQFHKHQIVENFLPVYTYIGIYFC